MSVRRTVAAIVAALVLSPAVARAAQPTIEAGTYAQFNPGTKRVMDPANQIVIVNGKNGRLAFSVNAIRALDQNSGFIVGTLPGTGTIVTWATKADGISCRLTFTALGGPRHALKVAQDYKFGDCGFGYGVTADGTYVRTRADGPLGKPAGP